MTRSPIAPGMIGALALVSSVLLASCTGGGSSPSASTAATSSAIASVSASLPASALPSASATALPSAEPTESLPPFACLPSVTIPKTTGRAQITDVRVGTHTGYDRVTFEFSGGIPQTVIDGVLPPFFADPSGLPLDVAGSAFLKVTMTGGTTLMPDGSASYGGSTNVTPGLPQIVQLREGGDFEAISTWYIGLNGGACYRVLVLTDPARLVIDIEQ